MLDKTSEKVLKFLVSESNNTGNKITVEFDTIDAWHLNMSFALFCSTCKFLQDNGYVEEFTLYFEQENGMLQLTFKGYTYFEYKRIEKIEFYKQLALSKISDILVSVITTITTIINWESIVEFFIKLF